MNNKNREQGLMSRYVVKNVLGNYNPWQGYRVVDSLSDKRYLLFSLMPPSLISLSLDDIKMRDYLFSKDKGILSPALSIQKNGGGITFLLPHADLIPLTKALPSMKSERSLKQLKLLTSQVLTRLRSGLFFHNLSLESVVIAKRSLHILPTAYLLPGEMHKLLTGSGSNREVNLDPVYEDLCSLGKIFKIFSRYLGPELSEPCRKLSRRFCSLGQETDRCEFYGLLEETVAFLGLRELEPLLLTCREPPYRLHRMAVRVVRQAAIKARQGQKHLVIVNGKSGDGKTRFLRFINKKLLTEWGFKGGTILSDQCLFHNIGGSVSSNEFDFVLIDDHAQENLLCSCIIDRLYQNLDYHKLAVVVVNENTPPFFIETLREMGKKKEFSIKEILLPSIGKSDKKRILSHLLPEKLDRKILKDIDAKQHMASMSLNIKASTHQNLQTVKDTDGFFDTLSDEAQSVLNFLAVFKFEIPLSIIQNIYSTEENGIYTTLQHLITLGLVGTRAEYSNLSGGELCLVYSLRSGSLSKVIIEKMTQERCRHIHENIALILKDMEIAPSLYLFYHLSKCGKKAEAAMKGYELFQLLLSRKSLSAINCFNESYLYEKLDMHLPPEMRFKLLLELGNYFSLIGKMEKAESLYRRCREETTKEEDEHKFRALAVEAVRRECEILENKGEFSRAKKLLERALESHGEHILSNERSKLYNDLAWVHYRLGQFDRSWDNCLIVHKLLDKKQHPMEIAQAYNMMGAINWNRSKYDDAILCHKRCLTLREDCNDEIGVAASYNNLGLVYRSMGRVREALECFKKSMEIKQRNNNLPGLAAAHLNIALAYQAMENHKEAEKNCLIASRLAEDIGNQQLLAETCGTMGEIYLNYGNLDKARSYYFRDLHICHKTGSLREKAVVFRRLAELDLAEGKIAETLDLLKQARTLNQKIGSRLETALLNLLEGRILLAEGMREKGRRKFEGTSLELSLLGRKNIAASIAAEIGELYLEEGNEPLAREYFLRSMSLVGECENIPNQVQHLQDILELRNPLSLDQIHTDFDRFRALCRVTSMIRTIHDPDKLHRTITETARKITGMKRAALILQNNGEETFRVLASGRGFDTDKIITDKDIIAILRIARQLGYPLDISRTNIPEGKVSADFLSQHKGIICIPLWIRDEVTGFLYLDSKTGGAGSSDEDHSFLVAFSQQVALGLERILLSEKITQMENSKPAPRGMSTRTKDRTSFQDIIGNSPAMRNIFDLIDGIKDMDTIVLLTGPNGTGKDLIAKAIHYAGHRGEKPFVSLNCSALPGELLESELFGHERGAFTGAHRQKVGHFEVASGGTIFLNEIGDMPLQLQPKLLRVLEEQKFYRVGGTKEITTNVRIITATNKDLIKLVKTGGFREDLYYRINIFPIRIPALRERIEDIEPLCNHFLTTFCHLYNIPKKKISPEAMTYLMNYHWPGNVRELENTINRLIIISKKDTILPEDFPKDIVKRSESIKAETQATLEDTIESLIENTKFSKSDPVLPKVEGILIRKMVEKTGDKTKAAKLLGISKPTLYSKLKNDEKNR